MNVLLVDLDENGSAGGSLRWATMAQMAGRSPAFTVSPAMPRDPRAWDLIVVDHPPGVRKLPEGQVVIPTTLDPGTYFSALKTLRGLKSHRTAPLIVANRCRTERAEVRRLLADIPGGLVIRDRAIYPSSFGQGVTILPGLLCGGLMTVKALSHNVSKAFGLKHLINNGGLLPSRHEEPAPGVPQ